MQHSLRSHQTGATFRTLSDHTMALTPVVTHSMAIQRVNEMTAIFHDPERIEVQKRGRRTRIQPRKLAIGARGSMLWDTELKLFVFAGSTFHDAKVCRLKYVSWLYQEVFACLDDDSPSLKKHGGLSRGIAHELNESGLAKLFPTAAQCINSCEILFLLIIHQIDIINADAKDYFSRRRAPRHKSVDHKKYRP